MHIQLASIHAVALQAASAELSSLSLAYAPDATTSVSSAPLVTVRAIELHNNACARHGVLLVS